MYIWASIKCATTMTSTGGVSNVSGLPATALFDAGVGVINDSTVASYSDGIVSGTAVYVPSFTAGSAPVIFNGFVEIG